MTAGERLRRARLDAGKTLDQVAAETKIQLWILEALEREDYARVPGGIFIRGYLAAFARASRLDPSEILTAYAQETAPPPAPPLSTPSRDLERTPRSPAWQYVAIAAVVLVGAVLSRNMARGNPDVVTGAPSPPPVTAPSATLRPPVATPTRPSEPGATATSGAMSPAAPATSDAAATASAPLVVQLHASDEVWVEATADGERKAYRLFEDGDDLRIEAQQEIRLLVGSAGAVSYTINGKPAKPLGRAGVVRDIVISPGTVPSLTS